MMNPSSAVLAIDPGSHKCGVAVVQQDNTVRMRAIVPVEQLHDRVVAILEGDRPVAVVCGDGTGSRPILKLLTELLTERNAMLEKPSTVPLIALDEAHTSELARARFVRENRPPLLQRLLPLSLRTPWCPYDDYVALILAERYWQSFS